MADTVVGDKESPEGAIGVVSDEVVITSIELGSAAIFAFYFENVLAGVSVTKLLGSL